MPPPIPIPSQSPATPDHRARNIARFRRHAPGSRPRTTGTAFTYDVNTNTNYNPDAEARAGRSGMGAIARYLSDLLRATDPCAGRGREAAA